MGVVRWKSVTGRRPTTYFYLPVVCSSSQFVLLCTMCFTRPLYFWCYLQCVLLFFSIYAAIHNGFHSLAQFLLLSKMCFTLHVHFGCCLQCLLMFFLRLLSVYSHGGFSKWRPGGSMCCGGLFTVFPTVRCVLKGSVYSNRHSLGHLRLVDAVLSIVHRVLKKNVF